MATMFRSPIERRDCPTVLRAILDPDCALAIWDRILPSELADLVAALELESVDDIDATIPAVGATIRAAVLLGAAGYDGETAVTLADEIGAMVDCVALIEPAACFRIRLEVVETDACRRFHADMVTVRLLVTLRGPGTQWIEVTAPEAIGTVTTGAVALFKGRQLAPDPVVLHRSPPIAGTGAQRLVLVIDPA